MKQKIALFITTILLVSSFGVCVVSADPDGDGQIINNPWDSPATTTTKTETPTAVPPSRLPDIPGAVPVVRVPDKVKVKKAIKKKSSKKIKIHVEFNPDITNAQLSEAAGKTIYFQVAMNYVQSTV